SANALETSCSPPEVRHHCPAAPPLIALPGTSPREERGEEGLRRRFRQSPALKNCHGASSRLFLAPACGGEVSRRSRDGEGATPHGRLPNHLPEGETSCSPQAVHHP